MIEFVITCDSERTSDGGYKVIQSKELVRCKDCKHYQPWVGQSGAIYPQCVLHDEYPEADWFCADGERQEGR